MPLAQATLTRRLRSRNRRRVRRTASGRSHYNYFRDYDPQTGRYIESDPAGLAAGVNTFAYVSDEPTFYFDPDGLGKQGGQASIGGNDPLIPKNITASTPKEVSRAAAIELEQTIARTPNLNPARLKILRAWIKLAKKGFTRVVACPPLLEELTLGVARWQCLNGDTGMCRVFVLLGGEIDSST